jgi:hypothetical protein
MESVAAAVHLYACECERGSSAEGECLQCVGDKPYPLGASVVGSLACGGSRQRDRYEEGHRCEAGGARTSTVERVHECGNEERPFGQCSEKDREREADKDLVVERRPLDLADISVGLMRLTPTDRDRLLIFTAAERAVFG